MMKHIPYGRHHLTEQDIQAVVDVLRSDFLTQGQHVPAFEAAFAKYTGAKHAVAVANGTAALHLGAIALGVDGSTKAITTPITFAASANCIRYCGGTIDFADIDARTLLIDLAEVEEKLKKNPGTYKGLIVVDFAGRAVNLEKARDLANRYGLWLLEDACHAPGGYFVDSSGTKQHCGNGAFADISVFSFHPVKHIATGEGGMITTNSDVLYEKLLMLRTHGITRDPSRLTEQPGGWYYEMQDLGFNYRLTDFQAALGVSQLTRLSSNLDRRNNLARRYDRELAGLPLAIFPADNGGGHAYHLYIVHTNRRSELYTFLKNKGILAQVHYIPVHTFPYYQSLGFKRGMYPLSEAYYDGCLSLPLFPSMTDDDQTYVIQSIREFFDA